MALSRHAAASSAASASGLQIDPATHAEPTVEGFGGLPDPHRPRSSCAIIDAPLKPLSLAFANGLRADVRTKTAACARPLRVRPTNRILQATTMWRTAGIMDEIETRVAKHESRRNRPPPLNLTSADLPKAEKGR